MVVNPIVTNLFIKTGPNTSMLPVDQVQAVAEKGIEGDRAYGRTKRQVLLVSSQVLDSLGLEPGDVRENITVDDLDVDNLEPGTILKIGSAELQITKPCEPCWKMDRIRPGLQAQLEGQRGMLARVIKSGQIASGDSILIQSPSTT